MAGHRRVCNGRSVLVASLLLAMLIVSCGDGIEAPSTEDTIAAATLAVPITTDPPFQVVAAGQTWSVPAAACLGGDGDPDVLAYELDKAAGEVEKMAGQHVSGWPTTTTARPDEEQAFWHAITGAGVRALALAIVSDQEAALMERWKAYEDSYADPAGGWGGIFTISLSLRDWQEPAADLVAAVQAACGASP